MNRACFPKQKHQNSQKRVKFMNFSFWPFLWFGLPGRLLKVVSENNFVIFSARMAQLLFPAELINNGVA